MPAKKTQTASVGVPEKTAAEQGFPHAVEPAYRAGWEHALTKKYGTRGKVWTSTKSQPQWTIHFRDGEAAAWFKKAWTAQ